jgi:hypothetical protein
MTLKEIYHNAEPDGSIAVTAFEAGRDYMLERALEVLDAMFMEQCSISVDDWFRDSPNLFQGREEFIKQMKI